MAKANTDRTIAEARRSFNADLLTSEFEAEHGDAAQLRQLVAYLGVQDGGRYLDLATGTGYVAFALARQYPECRIVAADIADQAIRNNADRARQVGLANIEFRVIDGVTLPFPAQSFDAVVCRYALHHFPEPAATLGEIGRVLKKPGRLVIADGLRDDGDEEDFINRFQALQPDGHVRLYRHDELLALLGEAGFAPLDSSVTSIAYSRALTPDYRTLLDDTAEETRRRYAITVAGDRVHARMAILNVVCSNAPTR
jgi:SAM-dependent methyltransferase